MQTDTRRAQPTPAAATFGAVIRHEREVLALTQKALAEQIGVSPQYVNDIERDRRLPSEQVLGDLAVAFSLEWEWLAYLAGRFPQWLMHPDATRASVVAGFRAFVAAESEARS